MAFSCAGGFWLGARKKFGVLFSELFEKIAFVVLPLSLICRTSTITVEHLRHFIYFKEVILIAFPENIHPWQHA